MNAVCASPDVRSGKKAEKKQNQPQRYFFSRFCRLLCADEFSSVFSARRTLKSEHFVLHYRPALKPWGCSPSDSPSDSEKKRVEQARNTTDSSIDSSGQVVAQHPQDQQDPQNPQRKICGPRLGIVVPKRLIKKAVHRNLLKRLGREQFRLLRQNLPETDVVLRLNKAMLVQEMGHAGRAGIANEIQALLEQLTQLPAHQRKKTSV